jgi:hypothetical protein
VTSGGFSGGKRNQIAAAKGDSTEIEEQSSDALPRRSPLDNIRHVCRFGTSIETRIPQTTALQGATRSIGRNCGSQGSNAARKRRQKFSGHSLRAGLATAAEVDEHHLQKPCHTLRYLRRPFAAFWACP